MAERKRNRTKKEKIPSVTNITMFLLKGLHVPQRKDSDQAADDTGDKNHDQGKVVNNDIGIIIKRPMADIFKP